LQPYLLIYLPTRPYTGVCLYTIIALTISDTFRIRDSMNYPLSTCHDTQITPEISYRFESTDCIREVSWYVYWIEVNGNRDDFMWILEANRPETGRDTYGQELIRTWDLWITDTKEAWIVHPIEVNSSRDNSELIPEANRQGDASATKSIEVDFTGFIRELQCYQLQHQWDLISYLPIESIDDYRDDYIAHTPQRVSSPAMPKPVIHQFTLDDSQLPINGHRTRTKCTCRGGAGLWNTRESRRSTSPTSVAIAITF